MHESDPRLLAGVWAHRGWSERASAQHYAALASAIDGSEPRTALLAASDDESVHAELCDARAIDLGGGPLEAPLPAVEWIDDPLLVLAIVCMGETLNVILLQDELLVNEDALTRRLLADEVRHARLGWDALSAAANRCSLMHLAAPITHALADGRARDGELAMLAPQRRAELLEAAIEEVLVPGFARVGIDLTIHKP